MLRKKTCKSFPQKLAQALLIVLLSAAGGMVLPHVAASQDNVIAPDPDAQPNNAVSPPENANTHPDNRSSHPDDRSSPPENNGPAHKVMQTPLGTLVDPKGAEMEYGPGWQSVLHHHEDRLKKYQEDQQAHLNKAQKVEFSNEKNMDDVLRTYPFLREDFQKVRDIQNNMIAGMNQTSDHSIDVSTHMRIAESRDRQSGINVLFVSKNGPFWCGLHGCAVTIYVDEGKGYKKTNEFISLDISLFRVGGQISLFVGTLGQEKPVEWIFKDHTFEKSRPPE